MRRGLAVGRTKAESRRRQEHERSQEQWENANRELNERWATALEEAQSQRESRPRELEEQKARLGLKNAGAVRRRLESLERDHNARIAQLDQQFEAGEREARAGRDSRLRNLELSFQESLKRLAERWQVSIQPLWAKIEAANRAAENLSPSWSDPSWDAWQPPERFAHAAQFGSLEVDLERLAESGPQQSRLIWPGPTRFSLPLLLQFPEEGSLLIETGKTGAEQAIGAINNIVFRCSPWRRQAACA